MNTGTFKGEVLGPTGKQLVKVTQLNGKVEMSFTPDSEGILSCVAILELNIKKEIMNYSI